MLHRPQQHTQLSGLLQRFTAADGDAFNLLALRKNPPEDFIHTAQAAPIARMGERVKATRTAKGASLQPEHAARAGAVCPAGRLKVVQAKLSDHKSLPAALLLEASFFG